MTEALTMMMAQEWRETSTTSFPRRMSRRVASVAPSRASKMRTRSAPTTWLTSFEAAALHELSDVCITTELAAKRSGLTRHDTRLGLAGLVEKGLARLDGGGYVLASAPSPRRGCNLTALDV